ncbi:haloacid dehalogenase-like hydrolase [Alkalicaulis satelles]|uniref:Haloacid dehalogenase-like hydrolase n=1 Tax=Alkalicaulis satelles TaxID=2609175 RepID=A0A5M6ZI17_9PROT|nr:HAD family hydrolase [Alkalicaulis satelles]KAA5803735.1 haloacid dehalogenase-like hydrolase [Alkalicaulis satelles]
MTQRPILAIAYDFDGTLSPGSMQEHSFIPEIKESKEAFWERVNGEAARLKADNILIYMHEMVKAARKQGVRCRKEDIERHGARVGLFPGVAEGWFDRQRERGAAAGLEVQHFIISSGLKEMIAASAIGRHFTAIFASEFKYDANDVPEWAAAAVNYTNKTQFLFRINKGALDPGDHVAVNRYTPEDERPVPFRNMIYVGDGDTDVPCMRMVKEQGGVSIAVHPPADEALAAKTAQLKADRRVHFTAEADYCEGSALDAYMEAVIGKIAAVERLRALERG